MTGDLIEPGIPTPTLRDPTSLLLLITWAILHLRAGDRHILDAEVRSSHCVPNVLYALAIAPDFIPNTCYNLQCQTHFRFLLPIGGHPKHRRLFSYHCPVDFGSQQVLDYDICDIPSGVPSPSVSGSLSQVSNFGIRQSRHFAKGRPSWLAREHVILLLVTNTQSVIMRIHTTEQISDLASCSCLQLQH